eukprot:CAMPEP_0194095368 /NCGR_PEP_ID=MMETSP0149-20130528/56790_1 /TAXON_ID=122233 /ORGANISM="Chaetoceros debilis, Strain MM31A-1" /LENGTH=962 /DNA_ID=CAMNT_0038781309 /DNA_START=608 /DNA_END=3496 /DNA_ORIENTATION=-
MTMSSSIRLLVSLAWAYLCFCKILPRIALEAYKIRLLAIEEYGPIIHEFDPYFNFRATEYLYEHGAKKFFTWFDYMVWYPLGRPVGTTIYPGMQFTAVWIKNYIVGDNMSLNDVCCYIPAWFGVIATLCTCLIAYECSLPVVSDTEEAFGSIFENIPLVGYIYRKIVLPALDGIITGVEKLFGTDFGLRHRSTAPKSGDYVDLSSPAVEIALVAGMVMSIVPAHLMRSMGGGYDNESVAMAAMTMTFYLWTRSLRGGMDVVSNWAWFWGAATGIAYFNMVAAWGGYVFVVNLIGVHAAVLVLLGRYSTKLYRSYTTFYVVGTFLAIQVPVVGWAPLKSLEQLGPCAVFVGFQLLEIVAVVKRRNNLSKKDTFKFAFNFFGFAAVLMLAVVFFFASSGYFRPITSRVRGLFVKHTKTGNPLVDSVAEHQPAKSSAYKQYLDNASVVAPIGFALVALRYFHDSSSFLLVYGLATYFFSLKMVRLILLTAPIASAFTGIVVGRLIGLFLYNIIGFVPSLLQLVESENDDKKKKSSQEEKPKAAIIRPILCKVMVLALSYFSVVEFAPEALAFYERSHSISQHLSSPTILQKGQLKSGKTVVVDDYRDCYWWIRDNTPQDSRIMAWWDYGYQLTAIANRTTVADGNTWNHEHIALLARALTSSEKEGHRIARHLADYVLVWAGGGGDDLAKSPHLARIANSVYRSMCPDDPVCSQFGMVAQGVPSKMMRESLLYKLHSHKIQPGVTTDPNRFREMFTSRYGKCRVFKVLSVSEESKKWVADPANKDCDVEGGWYCRGQYPPGMQKILKEKKDFSQLEDFNSGEKDNEYQEKYFENLEKKKRGEKISTTKSSADNAAKKQWKPEPLSPSVIEEINKEWADNPSTVTIWEMISDGRVQELFQVLYQYPELAHIRSEDGRGPLFWASEFGDDRVIKMLKKLGVRDDVKDAKGLSPLDLYSRSSKTNNEL